LFLLEFVAADKGYVYCKKKEEEGKNKTRAVNRVCILSPEKTIFYAVEEESLGEGRRQGQRARGWGAADLWPLCRRAVLPSILPGRCGLSRRLDQRWARHLAETPQRGGAGAGGGDPATSAQVLATTRFRSRGGVGEMAPTSADAEVEFEILTRPEVFEVGFVFFCFVFFLMWKRLSPSDISPLRSTTACPCARRGARRQPKSCPAVQ